MSKVRILVVDDAVVVRHLVTQAVNAETDLEVVGVAANGVKALERLGEVEPDVIILDVEMPGMDGLQTLKAIRQRDAHVIVIMFSRYTQRGVEATVSALMLGANDYVPKPGDGLSVEACLGDMLIPRIRAWGERARQHKGQRTEDKGRQTPAPAAVAPRSAPSTNPGRRVEVVGIGCSTGGPNALALVLPALPKDWNTPTLVAQHMPAEFTARMAERLSVAAGLRVREGVAGQGLDAAQVWVAPGDRHLIVERSGVTWRVVLNQEAPVNSCRPSADVLFASLVEQFGAGVLAVVLTGMGQDGLRGCERVRKAGGQVVVQDEASSVVWGMPGSVAKAGLADAVLPLEEIGPEIVRRVRARAPGTK
jgi:two-component system, chemotaxis family, protein-glutamate methylesterase/glutaminase